MKLEKITNNTFKELKEFNVVKPETYLEYFIKNCQKENYDYKYEDIQKKTREIFKKINKTIDQVSTNTNDAIQAIKEKDYEKLSLIQKELENKQSEIKKLKTKIYTDNLTNTKNKYYLFEEVLNKDKFKENGILVFIDLNKFKNINDSYGHLIGDKVLQLLCHYVDSYFQKTNFKYEIIRYGGDEFLLYLKNNINNDFEINKIYNLIKECKSDLETKKFKTKKNEIFSISFAFGTKNFSKDEDFHSVLEIADKNMYINKNH